MSDTLWRRMMVADTIHWFKKLWFCRMTSLHSSSFMFVPTGTNIEFPEYYPSYRCDLCGREMFN